MQWWSNPSIQQQLQAWLTEDVGMGDMTTLSTVPEQHQSHAIIHSKDGGILAGTPLIREIFKIVDPNVRVEVLAEDGAHLEIGTQIAIVRGSSRSILTGERLVLNLLQRMSGVATRTSQFVAQLPEGSKVHVVDTRKTTPGHRIFEKYAVRIGGGSNHRFGLFDAVLIKDNHIQANGGDLGQAIKAAKSAIPHTMKVEVEIERLTQIDAAIEAGADIIMLDNMDVSTMKQAVQLIRSRSTHVLIEASGGVRESTVRAIAETGVDLISVGALTHSIQALDISLDLNGMKGRSQ